MKKTNSNLSQSLDLNSNKFVQACAGAGKTFTLAKRYCAILDNFAERSSSIPKDKWLGVKNILVITFTKKAAAEMENRIYKDLNILLSGSPIVTLDEQGIEFGKNLRSEKYNEYKEWIRSTFSQNMISTIDGFCSKILKENAHRIGLDPMFKMEDETIAKKNFDELLNEFLEEKSKNLDKDLEKILNKSIIYKIKQFFEFFDNRKEELQDWIERINSKSENDIWQNWLENYTPKFDVDKWVNKFKMLWKDAQNNIKNREDKGYLLLKNVNNNILNIENNSGVQKRNQFVTEILIEFITKSKSNFYKKYLGGKLNWNEGYKENILDEFQREMTEEFNIEQIISTPNSLDRESIPIYKSLITLYEEFVEILNKYKDEHNYLTFNDVISKTNQILEDGEIYKKYRNRYSHIMVDEFQDTNDLRWKIIKKIASDDSGNLRKKGLFIVGDMKQSIYRFNNADVKIMNIARKLIKKSDDNVVDFNDNYRSSENYINSVINKIFPEVMKDSTEKREPYEAFFNQTKFVDSNQSNKEIAKNTEICCTINICKNDKENHIKDLEILQTVMSVKDALKWADENNFTNESGTVIAVLLRKFTHIQKYLSIFQKYNIDFEIVAGKGLFNQQEAFDIFHFIRILINPYDDLALVGLLRSPFFSVSDSEIHQMLSGQKYDNVYTKMKNDSNLKYVVDEIKNWRELSKIYSLDKLIYKILSENYREFGYFSEIGGKQRLANFDKILNIIFQLVLDGVSLNGIYDYFKFQIRQENKVAQAEMSGNNIVKIMTIHKAKGLEFPVVILPDLTGKGGGDTSSISFGEIKNNKNKMIKEVGISLTDENDESVKSNLLNVIKSSSKNENEAEDKRLFYVAITRAIYKIYFLADVSKLTDKS
ncbi:MAG: UvrD-helicase domain-containing protein, partial [Candidatus Marinimicrobia bacterium]|nr:UvrD-helicase domain-containing protein [Candidatus Neomarinimicrobiota bacterium]